VAAPAAVERPDPQAHPFTEPLNRTDALYFTITVFSTVGFGDIAPLATAARVTTMVQMLGDLVVVGVGPGGLPGRVKGGPATAARRLGRARRIIPSGRCRAGIGHLRFQPGR